MTANIKSIEVWDDNPQKDRVSKVVRIHFKFPCTWTILSLEELKTIIRLWIEGEEKKYPTNKGFKGRYLLLNELLKLFIKA